MAENIKDLELQRGGVASRYQRTSGGFNLCTFFHHFEFIVDDCQIFPRCFYIKKNKGIKFKSNV